MSREAMVTLRATRGSAKLFVSERTPIGYPDILRYFSLQICCNYLGQCKSVTALQKEEYSVDVAQLKRVTNDS